MFEGLSRWLASVFREKLEPYVHLVKNSEAAADIINSTRIDGDEIFIKLDIKDYYLSGTMDELTASVSRALHGRAHLSLIRDVTQFLVFNQYVRGRRHVSTQDEGAYRVVRGSGMGLVHSGDLADLSFLELVDLWLLAPHTIDNLGIKLYLRFRDDGLVVLKPSGVEALKTEVKRRARFYEVKVEDESVYRMEFLNLRVCKRPGGLLTMHYAKPTANNIPLSSLSGQAPTVHKSWPRSIIGSIFRLCMRSKDAQRAADNLRARFFTSTVPLCWPATRWRPQVPRRDRSSTVWLALPFHPSTSGGLQRILFEIKAELGTRFTNNFMTTLGLNDVSIAWQNGSAPLLYRLRSLKGGR